MSTRATSLATSGKISRLLFYGVFYHASLAHGARHVWMIHALNEEVQELVAQALEGRKLSMVEASVYKSADELQRLQYVGCSFSRRR